MPNDVALRLVLDEQRSYVLLVEGLPAHDDPAHRLALYRLPGRDEIAGDICCLNDPDLLALPIKARCSGEQAYELLLAPLKVLLQEKDTGREIGCHAACEGISCGVPADRIALPSLPGG